MPPSDEVLFADLRAERCALGCVLLDADQAEGSYARVSQIAREEDFFEPRHGVIFRAMGAVLGRGEDLDVVSLCAELRAMDRLNVIGGAQYVGELTDDFLPVSHCETHARIVRREADRRRVDAAFVRARAALRSTQDPDAALTRALDVVRSDAEQGSVRGGPQPFAVHAVEAWERIERASRGDLCPMLFGLAGLDRITGGFAAGQVVTIAGPQGAGKTALLAQILALNATRFTDFATARHEEVARIQWHSLEMGGAEMLLRHAAWDCGLSQQAIRDGALSKDQLTAVGASFNARSRLPIDFDGSSDPTALDVRAHAYASPRTRIVAVDWLGLLAKHPDAPSQAKDHELVRASMRTLKALARQRDVAVIVLNQFTQEANRGGKPSMHDMLGGAAVVNDSDTILVMHVDKEIGGGAVPVTIRAEKTRSSRRGLIETMFFGDRGEFREVERVHSDPYAVGGWPQQAAGDAE